jgi:hypothetical protein
MVVVSILLVVVTVAWLGLRTGTLRLQTLPVAPPLEVKAGLWCDKEEEDGPAPELWSPDAAGPPLQVRVVTYNLFWAILFGMHDGMDGSAGKLLAEHSAAHPYDFLGFQECEDPGRVLQDAGLQDEFGAIQGDHALCLVYRKSEWNVLSSGQEQVGEDQPDNYWGRRSVQWMRIQSKPFGRIVFFMNHHGPLQIDSGGICGGEATAFRLVGVATANAEPGDAILLVGDFIAHRDSKTVGELSGRLTRLFTGEQFGGIDHFFSNVVAAVRTENLGGGGSDHDALSVVLNIGDGEPVNIVPEQRLEEHPAESPKEPAREEPPSEDSTATTVSTVTTLTSTTTSATSETTQTTTTTTTTTTATTTTTTVTTFTPPSPQAPLSPAANPGPPAPPVPPPPQPAPPPLAPPAEASEIALVGA